MGVSVTHDPPTQTPSGDPATEPSSTPPVTPPTTQPSAGPTDDRYTRTLEDTLREQNRTIQELNNRLSAAPPAPVAPPPPPKSDDELRTEFFNNPMEANRRLIREELAATVGPLTDFVNQLKGGTLSDQLMTQFRTDPRFAGHWDADLEAYIRQQVSTVPPASLNEQVFGMIVVSSIGMKTAGMLPRSSYAPLTTPAPTPAPTPPPAPAPTVVTPPHMRPTPPAGPSGAPETQRLRPLTELEERLRRERGQTHEQYLQWLDMPSASVASADFDKPKPR